MKNKFGFILVKPQLGENIGASARSLKNFGFNNLIITTYSEKNIKLIEANDLWKLGVTSIFIDDPSNFKI